MNIGATYQNTSLLYLFFSYSTYTKYINYIYGILITSFIIIIPIGMYVQFVCKIFVNFRVNNNNNREVGIEYRVTQHYSYL